MQVAKASYPYVALQIYPVTWSLKLLPGSSFYCVIYAGKKSFLLGYPIVYQLGAEPLPPPIAPIIVWAILFASKRF
jgi:hypothetical protein